MPGDLTELRGRIPYAFAIVEREMLKQVCQDLDFQNELCRVNKVALDTCKA